MNKIIEIKVTNLNDYTIDKDYFIKVYNHIFNKSKNEAVEFNLSKLFEMEHLEITSKSTTMSLGVDTNSFDFYDNNLNIGYALKIIN